MTLAAGLALVLAILAGIAGMILMLAVGNGRDAEANQGLGILVVFCFGVAAAFFIVALALGLIILIQWSM